MPKQLAAIPYYSDWPKIESDISKDPLIEKEIQRIIALMTVEEKIGQIIQPDLRGVSPAEATKYKLGSILNGGGAWPNENKHATATDWASKADEYWFAVENAFEGRPFRIPFMWATDAVHGHNNAFRSTVFPHNIGLGCARDPELIEKIGRVTAIEVAATGLDWTFAPTVATPRDLRWGRVYEGYSEDPQITYHYASKMVKGLQGSAEELKTDQHVISNVKHWLGDGGTDIGVDRGVNRYSEELMINIHAMGYFSGLEAGAQVVMSSFNSWVNEANYDHSTDIKGEYNHKLHGSKYILNDVLKDKMGFDGLIVTDWHGHSEVSKCTHTDATYAINAGNDVLMVPVHEHWIGVYEQTLKDVNSGVIAQSRLDDAVTRILRVKMRAGLWDKPQPTKRSLACNEAMLGKKEHREIAREAVRKSMVLLKNNRSVLPLSKNSKILLTGSASDDLQKQSGGWNLTWQGDENTLADFPGATTMKTALEAELGLDNVIHDPNLAQLDEDYDIAVVVFGEDPYAEMMGDIKEWQNIDFASLKRSYRKDVKTIRKLHEAGKKIISVFFSGRPLYVNELICKSDAFIAAFLPGSEGEGLTDVIVGDEQGQPRFNFTGKLSYSWPNKKSSTSVNCLPTHVPNYVVPDNEQDPTGEHKPLFEYGYGLDYADHVEQPQLDSIELDEAINSDGTVSHSEIELYGVKSTIGDFNLLICSEQQPAGIEVSRNNVVDIGTIVTTPFNYQLQQDAVELKFLNGYSAVSLQPADKHSENLHLYADSHAKLVFELNVIEAPTQSVFIGLEKPHVEAGIITDKMIDLATIVDCQPGVWETIEIPLNRFKSLGVEFDEIDNYFTLSSMGTFNTVLANIRWEM